MKKSLIALLVVAGLILIAYFTFQGMYNNMVTREEAVSGQWANVETAYQRRADLIPNLVNTVKGYADFEQETLTQVIEARSRATSVNVNADEINPQQLEQFEQAQQQLSGALSRLLVTVERYPQLKANQNFMQLQSQLEGTENRISVERRKFNNMVRDYNTYIRKFPQSIMAGIGGFDKKGYFESEAGTEQAPEVQF